MLRLSRLWSSSARLIFAAFALLVGLIAPVHAGPPQTAPPTAVQPTAPDVQPATVIHVYLVANRALGPPSGAFFFVVLRGHPHSAAVNLYAYAGGDPVNREDPSGLDWRWFADANDWVWDDTWDGKSGVGRDEVPWTVRTPPSVRGRPGDRLGIDFYRQAGSLDPNGILGIAERRATFVPGEYVDPDPAWKQGLNHFQLTGSKVATGIAAILAAPVAVPAAFSSWAVGGTVVAEGVGFGFAGADALLDPKVSGGMEVLDRAVSGAAFSGSASVAYLALGRIPGIGAKAQVALASLFVAGGAVGTYESLSEGNYAQAVLRGTGTTLGASGLAGQFNPKLWVGNYSLTVEGSVSSSRQAGAILLPGLRYTGAPSANTIASYGQLRDAGARDGHHIIQNAAAIDLPGYTRLGAPAIQLTGPSTSQGSPHYIATQVQASYSGGPQTFAYERFVAYIALRRAGVSEAQARAAIEQHVDPYFQSLGVGPSTLMRPVGNRPSP